MRDCCFDRYKDNFDMIYNKYYVVLDDTILKGPIYTTEIEAQVRSLCKDAKLVNLESVFDKTVRVMKG